MKKWYFVAVVLLASMVSVAPARGDNAYARWSRGPSSDNTFFPIAVWLQSPARALQYKEAGINTYVGLWGGPNHAQLAQLKGADMKVVCAQNEVGLAHIEDDSIIGWMHNDEPDNAQSLGSGKGYGPPIAPAIIVEDYRRIKANDPSRPVFLNLGQGVAWDGWHGRGVRTNRPEDYPEYVKGCDIASFDIYPAVHNHRQVAGNLWYVARGVERLVSWSGPKRIVWNCIECTRINNADMKATPHQVRAMVWMSLVHGSKGLIYFVHEWQPRFNESALLSDPEMLAAVTAINRQIAELAPVLNSPAVDGIRVTSSNPDVPLAAMTKRHDGVVYVFAVAMRNQTTTAQFTVAGQSGEANVAAIGEDRLLKFRDGAFADTFKPWDVHLYKITSP